MAFTGAGSNKKKHGFGSGKHQNYVGKKEKSEFQMLLLSENAFSKLCH
jgi:hypothetical protein